MKGCILEANLVGQGWESTLFTIFFSNLGVEISSKKGLTEKEKESVEIEDQCTSAHLYWSFKNISCKACLLFIW